MRRGVAASLLGVAAATNAEPPSEPPAGPAAPAIEATNALVVVLDALTAKRSSAHGRARPTRRRSSAVRREGAGMPESAIPAEELERMRALGYVD